MTLALGVFPATAVGKRRKQGRGNYLEVGGGGRQMSPRSKVNPTQGRRHRFSGLEGQLAGADPGGGGGDGRSFL